MGEIFQLTTKVKINSKISAGFTFNVPSKWTTGYPDSSEIKSALLEAIGGKDATTFADWGVVGVFPSQRHNIKN